ncbi:hypothetical protein COU57_01445 [Candidatus Pacearchaeota archaeon CG10_big_fil_rev_8_21_14_0_10_32_14]|nr:MAG: hypothetical protein COU57_01445 [Candidatus Pacearchaeota archaeon CG10_big_fil_rev_8_21_14_0_10_32_14]
MGRKISLFEAFLKDKSGVASIVPSSKSTVKIICGMIPYREENTIIEYGPGTGAITKGLLKKMGNDSQLILIEQNNELYNSLTKQFTSDSRVSIFHDLAQNVKNILQRKSIYEVDTIVSGIPFSYLDDITAQLIVDQSKNLLKIGGQLIVYQFKDDIERYLRNFREVRVKENPFNIPPLKIYNAIN